MSMVNNLQPSILWCSWRPVRWKITILTRHSPPWSKVRIDAIVEIVKRQKIRDPKKMTSPGKREVLQMTKIQQQGERGDKKKCCNWCCLYILLFFCFMVGFGKINGLWIMRFILRLASQSLRVVLVCFWGSSGNFISKCWVAPIDSWFCYSRSYDESGVACFLRKKVQFFMNSVEFSGEGPSDIWIFGIKCFFKWIFGLP